MIVRSYMTPNPITLRTDSQCNDALRIMQEKGFHHLPVLGADDRLTGIVAERDLLLAALNFSGGGSVDVSTIMHRDVVSVRDDMPMTHAASVMARRAIGGLPVVDAQGHVIGVITETDIFRAFVNVLESRTARPSYSDHAAFAATPVRSEPAVRELDAKKRAAAKPTAPSASKKSKSGARAPARETLRGR